VSWPRFLARDRREQSSQGGFVKVAFQANTQASFEEQFDAARVRGEAFRRDGNELYESGRLVRLDLGCMVVSMGAVM
jgi:hypothetical protein